jgi:hypothetical protein
MTSVCTSTLESYITNSTSFDTWKSSIAITLNSITSSANPTSDSQKTLNEASQEIFNLVACLNEKLKDVGQATNDIQEAQSRILELNEDIRQAEEHVKIAKDRVAYIRNPDQHTSYYESWFPMGRPMQPDSIPIFIAVDTFLFIFIILMLGSYFGLNISLILPKASYSSGNTTVFTFPNIMLAFLVGFIIYYFLVPK